MYSKNTLQKEKHTLLPNKKILQYDEFTKPENDFTKLESLDTKDFSEIPFHKEIDATHFKSNFDNIVLRSLMQLDDQGISWSKMSYSREAFRKVRALNYRNYRC